MMESGSIMKGWSMNVERSCLSWDRHARDHFSMSGSSHIRSWWAFQPPYTAGSDEIFISDNQCLWACKYSASVSESSEGKWDSSRAYLPTALPNGIFLNLRFSLKQIWEREAVVSIERGMKSFKCIIMRSASGIPVGTSSWSFSFTSASRNAGPRATQFTAGLG